MYVLYHLRFATLVLFTNAKSYPERVLQEGDCWLVSSVGNPSLATRTDPVAILNRSKASSLPLSMAPISRHVIQCKGGA